MGAQEAGNGQDERRTRRARTPVGTVTGHELTPPCAAKTQLDDERPQQRQEADGASRPRVSSRSRRDIPSVVVTDPLARTNPPPSTNRPSASSRTPLRLSTSSPTRTRSRFSSTRSSTPARARTRPGSARRAPSAVRPSTSRPSAASTRPSRSSPSVFASRRSATSSRSPSAVSPPLPRLFPPRLLFLLTLGPPTRNSCRRAHQRRQGIVQLLRHQEEGVRSLALVRGAPLIREPLFTDNALSPAHSELERVAKSNR